MPAPLTPYITLAATGSAAGLLPSAGRPPKGESVCHSRLMPCSLTDHLPLVWNLSVLWHGPDREVMRSCLVATQVVRLAKPWSIHLIFQTVSQWSCWILFCKKLWQVCKQWRVAIKLSGCLWKRKGWGHYLCDLTVNAKNIFSVCIWTTKKYILPLRSGLFYLQDCLTIWVYFFTVWFSQWILKFKETKKMNTCAYVNQLVKGYRKGK